jgi:hypothetical protein
MKKINFIWLKRIFDHSENPEQELRDLANMQKGMKGGKLEITIKVENE